MSGVYISGMEMPTNCDKCRIMALEDTNCVDELYCGCPIVFKAHPQGVDHRPDYCPFVPVPPHGRLIDADALRVSLAFAEKTAKWAVPVLRSVLMVIDEMPTIIPADSNASNALNVLDNAEEGE